LTGKAGARGENGSSPGEKRRREGAIPPKVHPILSELGRVGPMNEEGEGWQGQEERKRGTTWLNFGKTPPFIQLMARNKKPHHGGKKGKNKTDNNF